MESEHHKESNKEEEYHWPALESNPEVLTEYMTNLGMNEEWQFGEVFGFDDECLGFVPQPWIGAIVTFETKKTDGKPGLGDDSKIVPFYMKQTGTLDNAWGIIACLHAIMNLQSQISFKEGSILDRFAKDTKSLTPAERGKYLEDFKEFKEQHKEHANQGQTEVPESAGGVAHHFVAFIKNENGQLIELDGTKEGPAVIDENCEDLLKGVASELQRRLEAEIITESLSMMSLNKRPE